MKTDGGQGSRQTEVNVWAGNTEQDSELRYSFFGGEEHGRVRYYKMV